MPTIHQTFYELFILLTTANFPDVMLPAYNVSWEFTIIFIIYLAVGLYFFLNIILASVFNVFKGRIEDQAKNNHEQRITRIIDSYNRYSEVEKETMDYYQAKEFFAFVFNWQFNKKNLVLINKNDVRTWRKIVKLYCHETTIGCPVHEKIFYKEEILKLFSSSQFIKYSRNVRKQIQVKDNSRKTVSPTTRQSRLGYDALKETSRETKINLLQT